ncbi:hypothetical protein H2O64_09000 [Kordia sp. YSTF-M3]|uniref:Ribosomal subunit interface protein n=1 Tax=Kordia aestuariivivens TaxID=2759037 RepID=A0ABR7Q8W7_9FLAO|nr:hypothetical protein [Kordia aestuariivivens]MBC8754806.1 hypothetical protein [Kordia aestuariivivens]
MNTTQEKIRQISLSADALHLKALSVDAATESLMKHIHEVTLELASKGTQVSGARILEAKVEKEMIHFKFDDPDNLIDHVSLSLNRSNPKAKIEVHHTSARS